MLSLRAATLLLLLFSKGRMSPRNLLIKTEDEGSDTEERKEGQRQGADYANICETTYYKPSLDQCKHRCAQCTPLCTSAGPAFVSQDCSYPDYSYCDCNEGVKVRDKPTTTKESCYKPSSNACQYHCANPFLSGDKTFKIDGACSSGPDWSQCDCSKSQGRNFTTVLQ